MNNRTFKYFAGLICLMAFSVGIGMYSSQYYGVREAPRIEGFMWPNPKQLVPFLTTDHRGEDFGLEQLMGKWSFLFFGYTHCPDICPITLSVFKQLLEDPANSQDLQAIFVTVDQERDTIERIAEYVGYFHEDMIGLGGNGPQIQSLTSQLGVVSMRGEDSEDGGYLVDHSASVFLIGPEGRLLSIYSAPHDPGTILTRFEEIKDFIN